MNVLEYLKESLSLVICPVRSKFCCGLVVMAGPALSAPFFSPHDPPPNFTPTPSDDALAQRISKLAQFAARNGPNFVELMRTKQAGNLEYEFLNGGNGSEYWQWTLYCTLYSLPVGEHWMASFTGTF